MSEFEIKRGLYFDGFTMIVVNLFGHMYIKINIFYSKTMSQNEIYPVSCVVGTLVSSSVGHSLAIN